MRDEIPYSEIVERLNDIVETVAVECVPDGRRSGNYWTGDCHGKCSVHVRGSKTGLVGFWQGQRPGSSGGNLIHLIEVYYGCRTHGEAVVFAKRRFLGIEDRPLTSEEKRQWAAARSQSVERQAHRQSQAADEKQKKTERARQIWQSSQPIAGTLGEAYFRHRGIAVEDLPYLPKSLRFHPHLRYTTDTGPLARYFPAVVCAVQDVNRKFLAVWQIFLDPDLCPETEGKARLGSGESAKLGFGPAGGGAVRLGPVTDHLRVTEGVETGFGAGLLNGWKDSTWCLLSTSGMRSFVIPKGIKKLSIYEDGDPNRFHPESGKLIGSPGIEAGKALRERALSEGVPEVINYPSPEPDDWLNVYVETRDAL